MHKFSHKKLPINFNDYFNCISEVPSHTMRHVSNNNIFLPRVHTSRSQRSIKYTGVKIWNNNSSEIKKLSLHKLKEIYKNFLPELGSIAVLQRGTFSVPLSVPLILFLKCTVFGAVVTL